MHGVRGNTGPDSARVGTRSNTVELHSSTCCTAYMLHSLNKTMPRAAQPLVRTACTATVRAAAWRPSHPCSLRYTGSTVPVHPILDHDSHQHLSNDTVYVPCGQTGHSVCVCPGMSARTGVPVPHGSGSLLGECGWWKGHHTVDDTAAPPGNL